MWNLERRDKLEALKKKLRKRLAASANGRLQSKRSLAKEFGVSPTTISRITRSFKDEGRVCCVPGQGVFALGADGERPLNFTPLFGLTGCYVGTASAHPDEMTSAIAGIPLLSGVQESSLAAKCALTLMPWGAMGFDAELARELGLSGLIIVGGAPEDELLKVVRTGIPAILANYPATSAPLLPFIDFDNERALRECVEALRAKGRRRPVFLTLGSHSVPGYGRWLKERLIIALAENGFSYDSAHYIQVEGGCEAASAEAECVRLLKSPNPPDSFICFEQRIASGALAGIKARGLAVPRDVSLIVSCANAPCPGLSHYLQPAQELGRELFAALRRRIADPAAQASKFIKAEFVDNGSV